MRFNRRTLLALGGASAVLAAFGGLTACQRQEPETGHSADGLKPLSMQSPWINDAEFIGYFIALDSGYYLREGLAYQYLSGGPTKVADHLVATRKATVALTNPETTVNMIVKEKIPFKIIGTQYQKSPLGIVSLEKNKIRSPQDLIGRRVAVPDANRITLDAFLRLNKIDPKSVTTVPYAYDPMPLVEGHVDATVDFVTNVPFSIRQAGREPSSFLFHDFGFKVFMDTVVTLEETIASQRAALVGFLRASRQGWVENFSDPEKWPPRFMKTHFAGTNRSVDNEVYFNRAQQPLMQSPHGYFAMDESSIADTVQSLSNIGIKATREMFDTTLLAEL